MADLDFNDLIPEKPDELSFDDLVSGAPRTRATIGRTDAPAGPGFVQTADDFARVIANGMSLGFGDKIQGAQNAGGAFNFGNLTDTIRQFTQANGRPPTPDEIQAMARAGIQESMSAIETGIGQERGLTQRARERQGAAATVAEIGGSIATPFGAAKKGFTLAGRLGTDAIRGIKGLAARTGLAATEGGLFGGAHAAGNDLDIPTGVGFGVIGGGVGQPLAEGVAAGGTALSKLQQFMRATPEQRAASQVHNIASKIGAPAAVRQLDALGPEAMAADVLGARGTALGRNAANISPEAREILESVTLGRKAGQNARVVSDLERAAGLPIGSRHTVDGLKEQAFDLVKKPIGQAYEQARRAGFDLPREPFRAIITDSPQGAKAYAKAGEFLKDEAASEGLQAASELARLDMTKRVLASTARKSFRAGDDTKGRIAAKLAKKLRGTVDEQISGPQYARARALRQEAFKTDEAFDLGEALAGTRVPLNLPGKAKALTENRNPLAKGFAAAQAERLLNRGSTEGALNALSTPLAREATEAALGESAPEVAKGLARERAFNQTAREFTANSTTARQLAESGIGVSGAGLVAGFDPATSFGAGLMRRAGPAIARKIATDQQRKAAPLIAEFLTRKRLPASRPIPPGILERLSQSERETLARALAAGLVTFEGL